MSPSTQILPLSASFTDLIFTNHPNMAINSGVLHWSGIAKIVPSY